MSAAFFVLLASCVPRASELTPFERAAVHAALEGWRAEGLPAPDRERCDFSQVYVRSERLEDGCPSPAASSEIHYACLAWESSGHWFQPRLYPVVVMRLGLQVDASGEPIVHELMHAQYRCAGLPSWTSANIDHLDPRVWVKTGGAESAQGRAWAFLQGAWAPP